MIRGLTKMNPGKTCAKAGRVPLLAVLLVLGAGLAKAEPMNVEDFTAEVAGRGLAVDTAPFPTTAALFEGGRIEVQSSLGTWHGQWVGSGDTFCLIFDNGPLKGQTCTTVARIAEGRYATSTGTLLRAVARAKGL